MDWIPAAAATKDCPAAALSTTVLALVLFITGVILGLAGGGRLDYAATPTRYTPIIDARPANCNVECPAPKSLIEPPRLAHSMDDTELFWRASLTPRVRAYPFHRVPKVAFMFLTRGPLPFAPLWDRFFKGHDRLFSVYVHAVPGYKMDAPKGSAFHGCQIISKEVEWGRISLIDAEKRLLANALLDFSNEHFVLLSESCIPVYDFPMVYDYLTKSEHSFVGSFDENSPTGRGRYSRKMAPDIELRQWRKGSQWFELNRELAVQVVADSKYYEIFQKFCTPACYPDEHYIPTYLYMFHGAMNANRSLTWVDWSRGGPHPARYGRESITEGFIQSIRNSKKTCTYNWKPTSVCFLFARKFAPSALEPLLNISSSVMGF